MYSLIEIGEQRLVNVRFAPKNGLFLPSRGMPAKCQSATLRQWHPRTFLKTSTARARFPGCHIGDLCGLPFGEQLEMIG